MRRMAATYLAGTFAACAVELSAPYGDLAINTWFDGYDCEAAGVESIEVEARAHEHSAARVATATCAYDAGQVMLLDLPADDYGVEVRGYDASGALLYDGATTARVVGGTVQEYDVVAPPSEGALTIHWTFEGSGACFAVYDVHVVLVDPFGATVDDALYPCSFGGLTYEHLMAGRWLVTLYGLDVEGRWLYAADRAVVVDAYEESAVTINLQAP